MSFDGVPVGTAAAAILCFLLVRRWRGSHEFGHSRLVPEREHVFVGETLRAVLEAGQRLGYAREVRFDLVEMHRSTAAEILPDSMTFSETVRASTIVSVGSFQVMAGSTRVPLALTVPADGWASFRRSGLGFSLLEAPLFIGRRVTEHAWEIRASADLEGARYRKSFRVTVESLGAPEPMPVPQGPRPILIPPSDKLPSRSS